MRVQPNAVIILPDEEKLSALSTLRLTPSLVSHQQVCGTSCHLPQEEALVAEYGFASAGSAVRGKADGWKLTAES
jgi:hypothetical protein